MATAPPRTKATSPDGAKTVTVLVFTEGTVDVAQKQDQKLKAGLG